MEWRRLEHKTVEDRVEQGNEEKREAQKKVGTVKKTRRNSERKQIRVEKKHSMCFFFCNVMQIPVFNLFSVSFLLWV